MNEEHTIAWQPSSRDRRTRALGEKNDWLAHINKWKPFPPDGFYTWNSRMKRRGWEWQHVDWLRTGCLILVQQLWLAERYGLTLKEKGYSSSMTLRFLCIHTYAHACVFWRGRKHTVTIQTMKYMGVICTFLILPSLVYFISICINPKGTIPYLIFLFDQMATDAGCGSENHV